MKDRAILLPVSGSQESLYAAEFAQKLAKKTGSKITAQHVIDIRGALEFIGFEKPGLLGSGPHISEYEVLSKAMRELANKIEDAYLSKLSSEGVENSFVCDEGDPVEEIQRRASEHSLVVMGHGTRSSLAQNCQIIRKLSLAEHLAHVVTQPTLILQKPIRRIAEFSIFCSMDHVNKNWLGACLKTARSLGADCKLNFLATGLNEEAPQDFAQDLRDSSPALAQLPIKIIAAGADGQPAHLCEHHVEGGQSPDEARVVVVPTIDCGQHRQTLSGECPGMLIRRLSFDSILFWPEENAGELFPLQNALCAEQKEHKLTISNT